MIERYFWRPFARFLSRPIIVDWLFRQAKKRPYDHLPGYMNRWWLVPYSWRLPFAIRIHEWLREDIDPNLHDHPWNFRSIVLRGCLAEVDQFRKFFVYMAGDTYKRYAREAHRVVDVENCITLFISFKWRNRWGFWVLGFDNVPHKIYYKDYFESNPERGHNDPLPLQQKEMSGSSKS